MHFKELEKKRANKLKVNKIIKNRNKISIKQ